MVIFLFSVLINSISEKNALHIQPMAHLVQYDVTVDMGINSSLRGIEKYAMQAEKKINCMSGKETDNVT
jgi:hypothetical protein